MSELATAQNPWDVLDIFPTIFNFGLDRPQMRVEEYREGNTLVIRADMPGIDPDKDVKVTLENSRLHIEAERREALEHRTREGYRSEIKYGAFSRDLTVPEGTQDKDILASYVDGVLQVRIAMPKSDEKPTQIPVTRKSPTTPA
jgi:HSP20 family protein